MKKVIYMLAVFAALSANEVIAQNREEVISRTYEQGVFTDERGEYRWQVIERRVWIPEYRTRGIFGVGSRTIPGHYEMRTDRIKVYTNDRNGGYGEGNKGWKGKHPHGMPPGQRKKQGNRNYY